MKKFEFHAASLGIFIVVLATATIATEVRASLPPSLSGLAERPLRTLQTGSELYVALETPGLQGDLRPGAYYQNGGEQVPGTTAFDEAKPFCVVSGTSEIPALENRIQPLILRSSEGGMIDHFDEKETWLKFITTLDFESKGGRLEIQCMADTRGLFRETTLGELEAIFGPLLRYGNLSVGDPGIEKVDPLFPEYDVLTPTRLHSRIQLEAKQDLVLLPEQDRSALSLRIEEGHSVEEFDFLKPYCSLHIWREAPVQIQAPGAPALPPLVPVTIPAGTILRFTSVSGDYNRSEGFSLGFQTWGELSGFTEPVSIFCSSLDPSRPLRYAGARSTTGPLLDWVYTF